MSPTIKRAALLGTAFSSDCISITSTIELSSITRRSQSSGFSSSRLKPKAFGSNSSSRWIVLASMPVASVMRLAARPVGAQSRSLTDLAARMRKIEFTMVVLPTPGPPVITMVLDWSAVRMASAWLSARIRPVFARSRAMLCRHRSQAKAMRRAEPASDALQCYAPPCKARLRKCSPRRPPYRLLPSHRPVLRAARCPIRSVGTSSSLPASPIKSARGRPQWPLPIASLNAKESPRAPGSSRSSRSRAFLRSYLPSETRYRGCPWPVGRGSRSSLARRPCRRF